MEDYELNLEKKNGEKAIVSANSHFVFGEDGQPEGVEGTLRDITDRKESEKRESFLHSLLRHDVRNKVQIVQGYLKLLRDFDLPEEAREYIKKAERGSREEMEIIEKVRTLRQAEEEEVKRVDISPTIHEGVDKWEPQAEEKDIEIITECPADKCWVKGGSLLDRVFSNIVENSIQHSGGTRIKISGGPRDGEVVCIIEDDGEGIPEEEKGKIFEKGYTTDEDGGTGLGMFLVKKLLEIYGGRIEIEDSKLGGARFEVYLKKAES